MLCLQNVDRLGDASSLEPLPSLPRYLRRDVAPKESRGFAVPLAERALAVYDQASVEGWGGKDCIELPAFWSSHNKA
jgi:3-hydroxyisobutyrate dehydrogenase